MFFSKVFNSFVGKYRGGSKDSLLTQSNGQSNDGQSKCAFAPGIEINPANGERIVVTRINGSDSYLINIAGISDNVSPDTLPGERRFFSVDDSLNLSAYLKLKKTGILELNGNDNFAVLYNELLAQFNELKSTVNSHISLYNGHLHPGSAGVATTSVATPSSADITQTKSNKVLLPSNA